MICYLDNAATTRAIEQARSAADIIMNECYFNPSAVHAGGIAAYKRLQEARGNVAAPIGAMPTEVYFTGGGTEATNTALFGAAFKNKHIGKHIVSTMIEHDATLKTLAELKKQGFDITLVKPQGDGTVSLRDIEAELREDTILLSIMAVNNETGAVLPYSEASAALKRKNSAAICHLDAIQAYGKIPVDMKNIDLCSLSAHKIGGLKGCGALFIKKGLKIRPLIYGGGQEGEMRSGTENMVGIAAFSAAAQMTHSTLGQSLKQAKELKNRLLCGLEGKNVTVNSPSSGSPYVISISPQSGRSEVLIRMLSDRGIYVSGGSACARGKRSHVLSAMNLRPSMIDSALRISLCPSTTEGEIDWFLQAFEAIQNI